MSENPKKLKTFIALFVFLNKVEDKYRGNNGNCQFTIVCRAKSKKEVARILADSDDERDINRTYHFLRTMGIHEASDKHKEIPQKDNTIYFQPEATKSGYYENWIEYAP